MVKSILATFLAMNLDAFCLCLENLCGAESKGGRAPGSGDVLP